MRVVGSGDDDEADFFLREKLVERADDFYVGIFFGGFVAGALEDGGEMQAGDGANDRGVEGAASEAETDEADFDHEECSVRIREMKVATIIQQEFIWLRK
jgi:hypothetical protein